MLAASDLDWSEIDPSILGTLFERGLDPGKRAQLGAHYTDRDKILLLIEPVVIRPWLAEWATEKAEVAAALERAEAATSAAARTKRRKAAERRYRTFLNRLRGFTVLDPACGSGNFLYLALQALKDLEHRVQLEAEALGFQRAFPEISPANVKGIEINPYAAELARVAVWIGEIQWMRRNGFAEARNPILKPLDTIECRDAILTPDNTEPKWPEADVVIGNPPFLGGKLLITTLGEDYVSKIFTTYDGHVPAEADLVCYWFEKAGQHIAAGKATRAGLVATNSIRGGANRRALQAAIDTRRIFEAWSDEPWVIDGAAVRVSLVCFSRIDDDSVSAARLDGQPVDEIYADLTARRGGAGVDLTVVRRLSENANVAFMGDTKGSPFDVAGDQARAWLRLPANPNGRTNADVLKPWVNGMDLTRRPAGKWIVDFGWTMSDERRRAVRRAVPVGEGARVANMGYASSDRRESLPQSVLVATRRTATGYVARRSTGCRATWPRRACRQAPVVRLAATRAVCPDFRTDCHRARRRHDLRHPAQPVPRGVVAPARHVALEGHRPALHPEHHLRDVSVPRRTDTRTLPAADYAERPARRRHRGRRPPAGRVARPLAQPARMGRVGGRAGRQAIRERPVPRDGDAAKVPSRHAHSRISTTPARSGSRTRTRRSTPPLHPPTVGPLTFPTTTPSANFWRSTVAAERPRAPCPVAFVATTPHSPRPFSRTIRHPARHRARTERLTAGSGRPGNVFVRSIFCLEPSSWWRCRIPPRATTAYDASRSASRADSRMAVHSETIMSTTAAILEKS